MNLEKTCEKTLRKSKEYCNDNGDGTFRCQICGETYKISQGKPSTYNEEGDLPELICNECYEDETLW